VKNGDLYFGVKPGEGKKANLVGYKRLEISGLDMAGWVARTRPLAEPLSPRGPQPVLRTLRVASALANGPPEPPVGVRGSWY
jgi:hypothetical protein